MLRNESIFQNSTLICLSSISICNLLIDLPTYIRYKTLYKVWHGDVLLRLAKEQIRQTHGYLHC
jgi:hypothetical protein